MGSRMHRLCTLQIQLAFTSGLASVDLSHPAAPPLRASAAYVGDTVVTCTRTRWRCHAERELT